MRILTSEELREALSGLPVGNVYCFETIGSTNDFGFERAAEGDPDMTIITAREQTKGRGRMQRKWVTAPGSSLPMTIIIRPTEWEKRHINLFSPLTGLAVHETLRIDYGIDSSIKWPNDVLLNRKKTSGILCETQWEGDQLRALILGIGVNLLQGSVPDIPDITYPATSIEDETGITIPAAEWIRGFVSQILRIRPLIGKDAFFDLWESCLAYKGEKTTLVRPDGTMESAVVRGIAPDGSLITEMENGETRIWLAGEISLRPAV